MKASIRRFHSPDNADFEDYRPPNPEDFGFLLQILAGPAVGSGEESFDVIVCSPQWLSRQMTHGEIRSGRHYLLTRRYDWYALERSIRAEFDRVDGESWREVAERLSRLGRWEFEDYVETGEVELDS